MTTADLISEVTLIDETNVNPKNFFEFRPRNKKKSISYS